MDYYPQNTVANYITHLPRTVQLPGVWEVAVVEAHYPCSFATVDESSVISIKLYQEQPYYAAAALSGSLTGEQSKFNTPQIVEAYTITEPVPTGNYQDVQELIDMLNTHKELSKHLLFEYNSKTNKVQVETRNHVIKVNLPQRLALLMGFDPKETDIKQNSKPIRPVNLQLGLPSYLYIYCDVVEPQLIGDTMAPLLQVVNIDSVDYVYGANKYVQFQSPHYIPVMKSSFESIEVDLRDDTGNHIPFQFGTSCVKLHFRRRAQWH